ncbi:hypothetical protein JCM11641_000415 [Rhodosporidiobolus odoratus]
MLVSSSSRLLNSAAPARSACAVCQTQKRYAHKLIEIELIADVPSLGRRGQRLPVSPGTARNHLLPNRLALYVDRHGVAVSPLQRMLRKEAERAGGLQAVLAKQRAKEAERKAQRVLDEMSGAVNDPQAAARSAEQTLYASLTLLDQPLPFNRLTTSPTSVDLFGSVSAADVLAALKEREVHLEAGQGAFAEQEGVEKGRVKRLGEFTFEVQFKVLGREYPLQIRVDKA